MSTTSPGSLPSADGLPPIVEQPPLPPSEVVLPAKPTEETYRIRYVDSLKYIFAHPEWLKNLLVFFLFTLIPVLNTALLFGYLYEIVEHRYRRLPGAYPPFEVRRFAAYVTRGIWGFLLAVMIQTILAPLINIITQGTMFGSMAAVRSGDWGTVAVAIVVPLVIIGFLLLVLALQVGLTPFFLRGGLTQDFLLMANFRWIWHFLRTMWLETMYVCLFSLFTTLALALLGCSLLCVGVFLVPSVMAFVQAHLHWQLYELYLARGGEPIPLRPLPATPATQA